MIKVILPTHLRRLANTHREVEIQVDGAPTITRALDALEERYPMLRGTLRDQASRRPRPYIRFFVLSEDWTHEALDEPLPEAIAGGEEPLRIIGAMAGG